MVIVNITEAKARLSSLIASAVAGEPFVICKAGKPLVKVERLDVADGTATRRLGLLAEKISVPDDFDQMGREEIEEMFYGPDPPAGSA